MKNVFITIALIFLLVNIISCDYNDKNLESATIEEIQLTGDSVFPEGIAANTQTGAIYVSSIIEAEIQLIQGDNISLFMSNTQGDFTSLLGMAVDENNDRLWVVNTNTVAPDQVSEIIAIDIPSKTVLGKFSPNDNEVHFLNDVTVDALGNAYISDSFSPTIWQVKNDLSGMSAFVRNEVFLNLTNAQNNFPLNLNGLAVTNNQNYLIASTATSVGVGGTFFRINLTDQSIAEVNLSGLNFAGGDGIIFFKETELVAINPQGIFKLNFDNEYLNATVEQIEIPNLDLPTTAAIVGERLYVTNSQLDHISPLFPAFNTPPNPPFKITSIPFQFLNP